MSFSSEAGTVILACTVAMWLLLSFPRDAQIDERFDAEIAAVNSSLSAGEERDERIAALENERAGEALRSSYGCRLGHLVEPAVAPLGFDWKIGIGVRQRIKQEAHADGRPIYTPLVDLALMVFFAIACQCMNTFAVDKRETRSFHGARDAPASLREQLGPRSSRGRELRARPRRSPPHLRCRRTRRLAAAPPTRAVRDSTRARPASR